MTRTPDASRPGATGAANLFAPWRHSYMDMLGAAEKSGSAPKPEKSKDAPSSSFLREAWVHPELDAKNHVIVRTGTEAMRAADGSVRGGLIMLNKYPYSNGHLLVCLGEPRARMLDYSEAHRAELWSLTDLATELCERTLEPQGVNVGINQGVASGAGVPGHIHVHIVPRWLGDVNFIAVVANIRVIPSALDDMWRRYTETWNRIRPAT